MRQWGGLEQGLVSKDWSGPLHEHRVAIVHDWLHSFGGAEAVLKQCLAVFPTADVFTLFDFMPNGERSFIERHRVETSFLQKMPLARRWYRHYLPLMPFAIEQLDLSGYDLIISSHHAVAKGVLTGPDQLHLCYCHSPMRYIWDRQFDYLREAGLQTGLRSLLLRWLFHRLRIWDARTANGVDHFLANSGYVARRIQKAYRREADIIYPPVDLERFRVDGRQEDFYLTASRLVPNKRVRLIVEAFNGMADKKLVVVGDGPEMKALERAAGPNVELIGWQPEAELATLMGRARAFVFAAEEDFGIAPVEAQAAGVPVIALGKGGALESIRGIFPNDKGVSDDPTGVFFAAPAIDPLRSAVQFFEANETLFSRERCRDNARRFDAKRFRRELEDHARVALKKFKQPCVE